MERRRFLVTAGAALGASIAGCTGQPGGPDDDPTDTDEDPTETDEPNSPSPTAPDPTDTPTETDGGTGNELVSHDSIQFATTSTQPDWFEEAGETVGDVIVIDSAERAHVIWPHDEVHPDRREEVADFLDEASFDDSVLLYVQSVGPDACHNQIDVESVGLEDGEVTATASVADTSGDDQMCAETLTFSSVLIRATFSEAPVTEASVSLTDGWGNEADINASADDPLSPAPEDLPGYVRPDDDPANVPATLECDQGDVRRLENWIEEENIEWGEATDEDGSPTLALRVDRREVALGESVEITMTNVTDAPQYTGNRNKYAFEVKTEAGWEDVRVNPDGEPVAYTDEAIEHAPDDGFEWTFELTEDGILAGHAHEGTLEVCPDLSPGRYRFTFFEPAVAVAFDVTE